MIIVLGSARIQPEHLQAARELARQHVARSRAESGCLAHAVYESAEQPNELVFVEEWASEQALQAHFAVPASQDFARQLGRLAAARPSLRVFRADAWAKPFSPA